MLLCGVRHENESLKLAFFGSVVWPEVTPLINGVLPSFQLDPFWKLACIPYPRMTQ
jgi:hypothetical protein